MRKLYYFKEYASGRKCFVAANNKYSVIALMSNYLSSNQDKVELIGKFYGAKFKVLKIPTIIE